MGDTSETNTNVLSRELILGVVALQKPIQKNHYMCEMRPFQSTVTYVCVCVHVCVFVCVCVCVSVCVCV